MGKPKERLSHTIAVATLLIFMTVLASAAHADTGTHYLCVHDGQRSFSKTPQGGSCSVLREHDDSGWVNFVFAPNVIVSYYPRSIVREAGTVKVWLQVNLASPVPFVGTDGSNKFQYDSVRAAYRLYCTERQQVLIQGTYSLGNKSVYERPSSEQTREEIQPNTLAAAFLNFFCNGSAEATPNQPRSSNFLITHKPQPISGADMASVLFGRRPM
jgi:hypothetical protein